MQVTFDRDGYVEQIALKGTLPNSIELEDDDTLDMEHITCYQLGYDGTRLVLDAKKVQRIENNLKADSAIYSLKKDLDSSDYKVLRHIRETALGIETSMTEEQYLNLEAHRESIVRRIREIENSTKLETDLNAILQEGFPTREKANQRNKAIDNIIDKKENQINTETTVAELIEEVVEEKPKKTRKRKTTKKATTEETTTDE